MKRLSAGFIVQVERQCVCGRLKADLLTQGTGAACFDASNATFVASTTSTVRATLVRDQQTTHRITDSARPLRRLGQRPRRGAFQGLPRLP